jgi:hypothetical protein
VLSVLMKFSDGSRGTVESLRNSASSAAKDYCEAYCQVKAGVMDNSNQVLFYRDN